VISVTTPMSLPCQSRVGEDRISPAVNAGFGLANIAKQMLKRLEGRTKLDATREASQVQFGNPRALWTHEPENRNLADSPESACGK
jgi:hypothetical protein